MRTIRYFQIVVLFALLIGCSQVNRAKKSNYYHETLGQDQKYQNHGVDFLSEWQFRDLYDPRLPKLITSKDNKYYVDPKWEPERINYLYTWMGYGEMQYDYSTIKKDGNVYISDGGDKIPVETIASFIHSISNLHPSQSLLISYDHTDDEPYWLIELIDKDGSNILIKSFSNSNKEGSPWNVYYNGRIYAQFDKSLFGPLQNLFGESVREPGAAFFPNGSQPAAYNTYGIPTQIKYGFWGLLPIADHFAYRKDLEQGLLTGEFVLVLREERLGYPTDMILLQKDGEQIPCNLDGTVYSTRWSFSCAPTDLQLDQEYHYQVKLKFSNLEEEITGKLWGFWSSKRPIVLMPPPPEILEGLLADTSISDLLNDHVLGNYSYSADDETSEDPYDNIEGAITYYGQTKVDDFSMLYEIQSPLRIENGYISYNPTTRDALELLLDDMIKFKIVKEIVSENPGVNFYLWYDDATNTPETAYLKTKLECPGDKVLTIPSKNIPLRAFQTYSTYPLYRTTKFYMFDDGLIATGDPPYDLRMRLHAQNIPLCWKSRN